MFHVDLSKSECGVLLKKIAVHLCWLEICFSQINDKHTRTRTKSVRVIQQSLLIGGEKDHISNPMKHNAEDRKQT